MYTLYRKTILVTGATGLIGSAVVRLLLRTEPTATVVAAARDTARAARMYAPWIEAGRCEVVSYEAERPLEDTRTYHYIIHAASGAAPAAFAQDPVGVLTANISGTKLLLDYGREHHMERLLYVSSGEVYGEPGPDAEPWREQDSGYVNTLEPRSCYPTAKRAAESLCAAYRKQYGTDFVVARPCHTYGPGFTPKDNRAYAQFLRLAAAGSDIALNSPGTQRRAWLYVDDCAEALLTILCRGEVGEAYNVADPEGVATIREVAEMIAREAGVSVTALADPVAAPMITRALFNTERLAALGWQPCHTLQQGLAETLRGVRRQ